jgi:soluble lytic murein transglycosylase-like protein
MTTLTRAALAAISTFSVLIGVAGAAEKTDALPVCEREMHAVSERYGIPLGVLYAVALTESSGERGLQPYVMNIAGKDVVATTLADALARFRAARARGVKLIDLGCMQINHHYHAKAFASVEEMFDPRRNVDYAARFLLQLRARHQTWTMAVARYNAGPNNNVAQKRYVCRVIGNMVKSGFGSWTPNSADFCGQRQP